MVTQGEHQGSCDFLPGDLNQPAASVFASEPFESVRPQPSV